MYIWYLKFYSVHNLKIVSPKRVVCVCVWERESETAMLFSMSVILKRVNVDCRINDFDQIQKHFYLAFYLNLGWTFWICLRMCVRQWKRIFSLCVYEIVSFLFLFYCTHMLIPITSMWRVKFGICEHLRVRCAYVYILFILIWQVLMKKGPNAKRRKAHGQTHALNGE